MNLKFCNKIDLFFRHHFQQIGILLVFGYGASTWMIAFIASDGIMNTDSYHYIQAASLVDKHGWHAALDQFPELGKYPPLLTILMVFLKNCGMTLAIAGRLLNFCGVMLSLLGVWFCCQRLYKRPLTALGIALLVSSLPGWYVYGIDILRDPLYWPLIIWSCYGWLAIVENGSTARKYGIILSLGVLGGIGLWCRKEMITFIALEVIFMLIYDVISLYKHRSNLQLWPCLRREMIVSLLFSLPILISAVSLDAGRYGYAPSKIVNDFLNDVRNN